MCLKSFLIVFLLIIFLILIFNKLFNYKIKNNLKIRCTNNPKVNHDTQTTDNYNKIENNQSAYHNNSVEHNQSAYHNNSVEHNQSVKHDHSVEYINLSSVLPIKEVKNNNEHDNDNFYNKKFDQEFKYYDNANKYPFNF